MDQVQHLQAELKKQFGVREIRYLASGDDSDAFLCDSRYVVKVPKHEKALERQKYEFQLYAYTLFRWAKAVLLDAESNLSRELL